MNILTVFSCFETLTTPTVIRQLAIIAQAMLTMTGRITMLSLSRWTSKGGSYRTINRFFATRLPWTAMLVRFFQTHLFNPEDEYILAGDATTITKAGTKTSGIDRFFSGSIGKVVKGLEFFVFSLINVRMRKSSPLAIKQTIRSPAEKKASKARRAKSAKKRKKPNKKKLAGRPKGVKNKDRTKFDPSPELKRINELLTKMLKSMRVFVTIKHLAMDGHFGHNQAVLMARTNGLELISKLRCDAALYEKYEGRQKRSGPKKRYGDKLDYKKLPEKYLKNSEREGDTLTNYYQATLLGRSFAVELNVVVIEKVNLKTGRIGHAVLFSSDLELSWEKLVDYYSLRFQIEFNFRDAKQHFGLEDFMTTTEIGVENAANLSFMMVNLSAKLLNEQGKKCIGINDLKSQFRGVKYALETLKLVQPKAEMILIEKVKEVIGRIGSIHRPTFSNSSA
jgi:putative transposase